MEASGGASSVARRDYRLLIAARMIRAFSFGFAGILVAVHLQARTFSPAEIGGPWCRWISLPARRTSSRSSLPTSAPGPLPSPAPFAASRRPRGQRSQGPPFRQLPLHSRSSRRVRSRRATTSRCTLASDVAAATTKATTCADFGPEAFQSCGVAAMNACLAARLHRVFHDRSGGN